MFDFDASVSWLQCVGTSGVFALWFLGIPIYAIRVRLKGHFQAAKVNQKGGTFLLGRWLMQYGYWVIRSASDGLVRLRVHPNTVTFFSLAMAVGAMVALLFGRFGLGGWLMLFTGILDVIDGMVARETGRTSPGGWYLDSVVDRYCEFFFFLGFLGYYFSFFPLGALVSGLALIASVMITFNRTKGETLGIQGVPSGLMRRHERLLYIGVGTAFSPVLAYFVEPGLTRPLFHLSLVAQGLVALLGNITAVRLARVFYRRIEEERPEIAELKALKALEPRTPPDAEAGAEAEAGGEPQPGPEPERGRTGG